MRGREEARGREGVRLGGAPVGHVDAVRRLKESVRLVNAEERCYLVRGVGVAAVTHRHCCATAAATVARQGARRGPRSVCSRIVLRCPQQIEWVNVVPWGRQQWDSGRGERWVEWRWGCMCTVVLANEGRRDGVDRG